MTPVTRQLTLSSILSEFGDSLSLSSRWEILTFPTCQYNISLTGVTVYELRWGEVSKVLMSARELWVWFFVPHQPSLTHFPNLLWLDKASLLLIKDLVEIACLPDSHTWLAVCITSILTASPFAKAEPGTQNNWDVGAP